MSDNQHVYQRYQLGLACSLVIVTVMDWWPADFKLRHLAEPFPRLWAGVSAVQTIIHLISSRIFTQLMQPLVPYPKDSELLIWTLVDIAWM